MPTRELRAPSQRAQFTDFNAPLDDRTLARFYTLSDTDLQLSRRHRRASTQLGFAVQLGYARLPGRVLRVGEEAHPPVVTTLASQLGVDPAAFDAYLHGRDTTRREHLLELQRDFEFRSFSATIYRELAGWLLPIALSTHAGPVLVGALVDELRDRKVLALARSTIERLAWETRRRAERLVFVRLTAALTDVQRNQLDALLVVQPRRADDHPGGVAPTTPSAHAGHLRGTGRAAADDPRHRAQPRCGPPCPPDAPGSARA
jgi:TnpA family transposase